MWFGVARKAKRFKIGRSPQDDAAFVDACGYGTAPDRASLALAIRRVIGESGTVEPQYIRADDRWPEDLGGLGLLGQHRLAPLCPLGREGGGHEVPSG